MKTEKGSVDVLLGPTAFLSQSNSCIVRGDELSVTGSNLAAQGTPYLIVREVSKGGKTLTLRNAQGVPLGRGAAWVAVPAAVGAAVAVVVVGAAVGGNPRSSARTTQFRREMKKCHLEMGRVRWEKVVREVAAPGLAPAWESPVPGTGPVTAEVGENAFSAQGA